MANENAIIFESIINNFSNCLYLPECKSSFNSSVNPSDIFCKWFTLNIFKGGKKFNHLDKSCSSGMKSSGLTNKYSVFSFIFSWTSP